MKKRRCALTMAFVGVALLVSAGTAKAAAGEDAVSRAIQQTWDSARQNIRESADQMPEAGYGFKPVEHVRTFGQILAHVAGANYVFCAAAGGEKTPHGEADFEQAAKTKVEIVKALSDSLAYCDAAYAALDDRKAAETVTLPFGLGQGSRSLALMMNTGHLNEHYGNLVTYFRIKGMVPPSTAREQARPAGQ